MKVNLLILIHIFILFYFTNMTYILIMFQSWIPWLSFFMPKCWSAVVLEKGWKFLSYIHVLYLSSKYQHPSPPRPHHHQSLNPTVLLEWHGENWSPEVNNWFHTSSHYSGIVIMTSCFLNPSVSLRSWFKLTSWLSHTWSIRPSNPKMICFIQCQDKQKFRWLEVAKILHF